jgi:hypothetical protein
LEEAEADPSLRMPEFKGSLSLPLEMMPYTPSGVNLFFRGIASPLATAYGIVGGAGVSKLRRVMPVVLPFSLW